MGLVEAILMSTHNIRFYGETRAGVHETLYPQHMLASKDNLETRCQSQKRSIIQSTINNRNLPKVNQVIYTADTICVPNIMILAQMVFQIFCWQGPLWIKYLRLKRGIIQSNIHRILWKVNQVIYIMNPNYMPDIMILAQAILQIFCWQGCFTIQNAKVGKGR